MKSLLTICFLLCLTVFAKAQSQQTILDSLHRIVLLAKNDTIRMDACYNLGLFYDDVNLDSSIFYCEKGISIAKRLNLKLNEAELLMDMSFPLSKIGNYPLSLKVLMQAKELTENSANEKNAWRLTHWQTPHTYRLSILGYTYLGFGELYWHTGENEKRLTSYYKGKEIAESIKDTLLLYFLYGDIGDAYNSMNKLDSALQNGQKAMKCLYSLPLKDRKYGGTVISGIGSIYQRMEKPALAREYFQKAIAVSEEQNNPSNAGDSYLLFAGFYESINRTDSSLYYARKALEAYQQIGEAKSNLKAYRMLSNYYWKQNNSDSSFAYLRLAVLLNDNLDREEKKKLQEFQVAGFNEQIRLEELEKVSIQTQNKIRTYGMLAGLTILSIIGFLLYLNNRQKQKANKVLQEQKEKVESTLQELKSTQSQLIQSEKMASLGELTAGIAHEIQNPLNFVNNFSEVSTELIKEMVDEVDKGNTEEVKLIANDVVQNLEKINHHGKRAADIVKGMLQHSRISSGVKEPTDINALCDEYLRLSYHGFRAKDKNFNATMITEYDESIGKIKIIPQDIGRVILNLINNAFYVVNEKKKSPHPIKGGEEYEPSVTVSTKRLSLPSGSQAERREGTKFEQGGLGGGSIEIKVSDNGGGIPKKILDKIFQPFFTTKPTGQGTGLGLSLSYDIVKAHGGELTVRTKEATGIAGEESGTEFIIQLNTSY